MNLYIFKTAIITSKLLMHWLHESTTVDYAVSTNKHISQKSKSKKLFTRSVPINAIKWLLATVCNLHHKTSCSNIAGCSSYFESRSKIFNLSKTILKSAYYIPKDNSIPQHNIIVCRCTTNTCWRILLQSTIRNDIRSVTNPSKSQVAQQHSSVLMATVVINGNGQF